MSIGTQKRVLSGHDYPVVDGKGRLLLPKPMRDALGDPFALRISPLGCLEVMSKEVVDAMWEELEQFSIHSEARNEYAAEVLSQVFQDLSFDTAGRFVVPSLAREECGISGKVYARGGGHVVQIWNLEEYRKYKSAPDEHNSANRSRLAELRRRMREEG